MTSQSHALQGAAPQLTLVTVTYNAASVLDDFWASLTGQKGVDWSLIVVDNASADDTFAKLAAIETDPRVTVIRCATNTGAAEGNNIGLRRALAGSQDYIVLCNNDVLFDPETLKRLAETKKPLSPGVVAPVMVFEDDRNAVWFERGEISTRWGIRCLHKPAGKAGRRGRVYPTDYAPTTFLIFDRVVFETVGELDSGYFAYWEDADYIWRVRKAGFGVWVDPDTTIVHKVSQSSGGLGSVYSNHQYFKNQIRFARKHFGLAACGLTALSSLSRIAVRSILRRDKPELTKAKLQGLWAGVSVAARTGRIGA